MKGRSCAICGDSLDGKRSDAIYCDSGCRYAAWVARHPEKARSRVTQRLATARTADSRNAARRTRKGRERGTRIYLTPADLGELSALTAPGSARIVRKVNDAMLRIGRAERP
jgi:hypothetical protein